MKASRLLFATLLASGVVTQALAATPAPPSPCISKAEMRAGLAFVAPTLVRGFKTKCAPVLSAESYMATRGDALIARLKASPSQNPAALQSLMAKVLPARDMPAAAGPALTEAIAETAIARMQNDLKPSICPKLDAAFTELDPLPAENVIGLLEIIVSEVISDTKRSGPKVLVLCAAQTAPAR